MIVDRANALCGVIFVLLGGAFAVQSAGLELGSAFRMGPGYFPLGLAIVLVLLGGAILFQSLRVQGDAIGTVAWRGMFFILPAPIFFGLTIRDLGFIASIFATCLIACFASRRMGAVWALLLSAGVTFFAWGVFLKGLGLPFRAIGPSLGG